MVLFRSRLERIIGHRWPIALVLAAGMAGVILTVITVTTLLDIRQERNFSRQDLETRGRLLANALNDSLADPLYFLDVDRVEDVTVAMEMSQDGLPYIQVFRPDGSLLTDTSEPKHPRGSLAPGFVKSVIQTQEPVLEFHGEDLEVTSPIRAGNQLVGIVHFDLSTASLHARLMDIIWDHVWQGLALLAVATLLAFAVARFVTKPLQALRAAALSIGHGDLDYEIPVGGTEETATLGQALDSMRTELKGLYQDLEGQVAERTEELSKANKKLEAEIVDRQRLAQESQLMAEIGRVISSSLEIEEVYETFAELVHSILPFDRISIHTVDVQNGTLTIVHASGFEMPGRAAGTTYPLEGTFSEQVVQSLEGLIFQRDDSNQQATTIPGLMPFFKVGTSSLLSVPLVSRGEVIAVLNLISKLPQTYSAGDLVLALAIGQQIAGAVANAQQFAERKRSEQESAVLAEAGRLIGASIDIEDVYDRFCAALGKIITFDWVNVCSVDQQRGITTIEYRVGTDARLKGMGSQLPLETSFIGAVTRTREAVLLQVNSIEETTAVYPGLEPFLQEGACCLIGIPLIYGEQVIAVLIIASATPGIYSQRDVEFATNVGFQITGTIASALELTERKKTEDKIKASLDEKEVLLKEINHRVKNNLQIISSLLNLQSREIQDEQALRSFQVSQDRIRAMALVHEKLYQSEDLARIDFGEYIKSLATDLGSSYGLSVRDIDLKIDVENILLGVDTAIPCGVIVNELVANSLKHAFPGDRSGEIAISFRLVDGQYTMVFKDDGVGLPEDLDINRPSSLGLTIVNALTGQLGGTIALGRNGGSEIIITFPAK